MHGAVDGRGSEFEAFRHFGNVVACVFSSKSQFRSSLEKEKETESGENRMEEKEEQLTVHLVNSQPISPTLNREHLLPPLRQLQLPRSNLPTLRAPLAHSSIRSTDNLVAETDTEELQSGLDVVKGANEGEEGVDPGEVVVSIGG